MAKKVVRDEHEMLLISLVSQLHDQGYSYIRTKLKGYEKPDEIFWAIAERGYSPDAVALKDSAEYMFAVETSESINDSGIEDKWKLFSTYSRQQAKKFVVVVPGESEKKAQELVSEMGIKVEGVWIVA